MDSNKHFCTCEDFNCKFNPHTKSQSCDLCIKKNLINKEIPSCFFRLINDDLSNLKEFTIKSFVEFYLQNNNT